jgi:hypothetical protein
MCSEASAGLGRGFGRRRERRSRPCQAGCSCVSVNARNHREPHLTVHENGQVQAPRRGALLRRLGGADRAHHRSRDRRDHAGSPDLRRCARHLHFTYAEAFPSQELAHWISGHVRAFEAWGGCPRIVVPDNPRTGVSKAHRYEPTLNAMYNEMAARYGVAVIPARPYKTSRGTRPSSKSASSRPEMDLGAAAQAALLLARRAQPRDHRATALAE